jgi:hypothetical protein
LKRPWFWGTLAFWLLLTSVGLSRALLWGPSKLSHQDAGRFHCDVNGCRLEAQAFQATGSPEEAADLLEAEWATEGWQSLGDGSDFFPLLLGSQSLDPEVAEVLRRCAQIRLFKRSGIIRILGVLRADHGKTVSGLTADIPEKALAAQSPEADESDTPAAPPEGTNVTHLGYETFHLSIWRFGSSPIPGPVLRDWCQTHAIQLKPWSIAEQGNGFLATRLNRQWFLNVESSPQGQAWVWVNLPSR